MLDSTPGHDLITGQPTGELPERHDADTERSRKRQILENAISQSPDETEIPATDSIATSIDAGVNTAEIDECSADAVEKDESDFGKLIRDQLDIYAALDELNEPFIFMEVPKPTVHNECLRLHSKKARARVQERLETLLGHKVLPKEVKETIKLLEMQAYREPTHQLYNRVATVDGVSHIDLCNLEWQAIRIDASGFSIVEPSEPMFRRAGHQEPLCIPTNAETPWKLFEHVNIESEDEKYLVMTWLLSAYKADGLCPILLVTGPQASGKSRACTLLRSLIDPSKTTLLGEIEMKQIIQTFQHQYAPCFENVSDFDAKTSDFLCRAVTGNGIERRRLFTDQEEVIFSFRRPIMINGITIPSKRLDLLDRSVVIHLKRLSGFQGTEVLHDAFHADLPDIFGSILNLFVKTLAKLPSVSAPSDNRMVDYCNLGRAMMEVLGRPAQDFDTIYRANINQQNKDIVEDSPLATLLLRFSQMHPVGNPWEGTTSSLMTEIFKLLGCVPFITKKDLPESSRWFSANLMEAAPALKILGVTVDRLPRTANARRWRVESQLPATRVDMQRVRDAYTGGDSNE